MKTFRYAATLEFDQNPPPDLAGARSRRCGAYRGGPCGGEGPPGVSAATLGSLVVVTPLCFVLGVYEMSSTLPSGRPRLSFEQAARGLESCWGFEPVLWPSTRSKG
jgi:hypothetical protein